MSKYKKTPGKIFPGGLNARKVFKSYQFCSSNMNSGSLRIGR